MRAPAYDDDGNADLHPGEPPGGRGRGRLPTFRQVAWAGSFEGQTTLALGVRARLPFRVFTLAGTPQSDDTPAAGDRRRAPLVAATPAPAGPGSAPASRGAPAGRRRRAGAARSPAAPGAGCRAALARLRAGSTQLGRGVGDLAAPSSSGSKLGGIRLRCVVIDRTSRTTAISSTTMSSRPSGPDLPTSSGSCCPAAARTATDGGGHRTPTSLRMPANRSSSGHRRRRPGTGPARSPRSARPAAGSPAGRRTSGPSGSIWVACAISAASRTGEVLGAGHPRGDPVGDVVRGVPVGQPLGVGRLRAGREDRLVQRLRPRQREAHVVVELARLPGLAEVRDSGPGRRRPRRRAPRSRGS